MQLETNKTNMKKVILLTFAMLALATVAIAQPRAIGARFGGHLGVSYEHTSIHPTLNLIRHAPLL